MATSDDTGTYVGDADTGIPADTATRTKGAAEIRKVKSQLAATFPNFTGAAVNTTEAELNQLDGIATGGDTVETRLQGKADAYGSATNGYIPTHDANGDMAGEIDPASIAYLASANFTALQQGGSDVVTESSAQGWDYDASISTGVPNTDTVLSAAHSLGAIPTKMQVYLKCVSADAGHSVGNEIQIGFDGFNVRVVAFADATHVYVAVQGTESITIPNASTAAASGVAGSSDWDIYIRASL